MASTISVRELRNHTADVVSRVEAGEALTLTVNGRPVADLVPHGARRHSMPATELAERFARRAPSSPAAARVRDMDDLTTDDVVEAIEAGYGRARRA